MFVVGVTFVSVVLVTLFAYWLLLVRPQHAFEKRIYAQLLTGATERGYSRPNVLRAIKRLSAVDVVHRTLSRSGGLAHRLDRFITESGLQMNVGTFVFATLCLLLAPYVLGDLMFHRPWLGLAVGAVVAWIPYLIVRQARASRLRRFEEAFPDALDLIVRAMRAGHAFTTGLAMVADEAPEPVAKEFRLLYDQQNFGLALPTALRDFAARVPLLDLRFFVTAVLTQRESGGNLSEVLENLAHVMRERFQVKRDVRSKSAHGRLTAVILILMPPVLAMAFFAISPAHLSVLITDPLGIRMVIVAVVLQLVGMLVIRRIVRIEY